MTKERDEYVWANYPAEYSQQLDEIREQDGIDFFIKQDDEGRIVNMNRLHPNWMELYDTVQALSPKSVFECGFGGGYHLKNIRTLLPDCHIHGCDLLQEQYQKALMFSELPQDIAYNLVIADMTKEDSVSGRYDFVYSMAVVMHLSTENAKAFLRNMGKISRKYIFMVEGVKNHANWYEMVAECLPDFTIEMRINWVDNGILLTRK